ncbi:MAG: PIG-L deacetylase family protein [Pseudomonadota bacterium]
MLPPNQHDFTGCKIAAIFAHPDDAELTCFGALSKFREAGARVAILYLTSGGNGVSGNVNDRRKESLEAASYLNAEVDFAGFEDGRLSYDHALVSRVQSFIESENPTIVFTHYAEDHALNHQDHIAVSNAVRNVLRRSPRMITLFLAESATAECDFQPNVFIDVTQHYLTKIRAIKAHTSQANKFYMDERYIDQRSARWAMIVRERRESARKWEAFKVDRMVFG